MKIPIEKESLSSAEMTKTMEQRDTTLGKSDVVLNEEKSYLLILILILYLFTY